MRSKTSWKPSHPSVLACRNESKRITSWQFKIKTWNNTMTAYGGTNCTAGCQERSLSRALTQLCGTTQEACNHTSRYNEIVNKYAELVAAESNRIQVLGSDWTRSHLVSGLFQLHFYPTKNTKMTTVDLVPNPTLVPAWFTISDIEPCEHKISTKCVFANSQTHNSWWCTYDQTHFCFTCGRVAISPTAPPRKQNHQSSDVRMEA